MCNGHSLRNSQGGSIAVLRSTQASHLAASDEELQLLFSDPGDEFCTPGTQIQLLGWERRQRREDNGLWVVIHKDGDLTTSTASLPPTSLPTDSFFTFPVARAASQMQLQERLDLGVGDTGIIGRRISVMTGSKMKARTVAEGIIGWN